MLKLVGTGLLLFATSLCCGGAWSQPADPAHGIFEGSTDIGATRAGSTAYSAQTSEYRVTGGGADMWGTADAFHMSWIRLSGDLTLTADVRFPADGRPIPLKKAVVIVRQDLDPDSPYADVAIHGDGHITLQFREAKGGKTADITSTEHGSTRLRIARRGNEFTMYTGSTDRNLKASGSKEIVLHDPVYVGIGVCAHDPDVVETAFFSNISLEKSRPR